MTTLPTTPAPTRPMDEATALDWIDRWDRQQGGYVYGRERAFGLLFDVVERLVGPPRRVLDLACGPGALAVRATRRWPAAEVVALDLDPVLLHLGRRAYGDRIVWAEGDLRRADWGTALSGPFDAVISATALHYLDAHLLDHVATGLAALLVPGGVFADCDTMLADPAQPRLAALQEDLRRERWARAFDDTEDFAAWWAALRLDEQLSGLFAERDRRFGPRRFGKESTLTERTIALHRAGFVEVDTVLQDLDKRILVAINRDAPAPNQSGSHAADGRLA